MDLYLPCSKNKKPETKDGKWFYDWSDEELLKADNLGFYHKQSNVFTIDFDDKNYVAHRFFLCSSHIYRWKRFTWSSHTHLTYKVNGQGALKFKYLPKLKGKKMDC